MGSIYFVCVSNGFGYCGLFMKTIKFPYNGTSCKPITWPLKSVDNDGIRRIFTKLGEVNELLKTRQKHPYKRLAKLAHVGEIVRAKKGGKNYRFRVLDSFVNSKMVIYRVEPYD